MAEPINHDTRSGVLTAGWSVAKWGIGGAIAAAAVGGLLAVGALALGGVIFYGSAGAAFGSIAANVGIAAASLAAGLGWGPIGALIGGLFGLAKGGSRVSAEKAAYREQAYSQSQSRQQDLTRKITDAEIAAEQRGYVVGAQDAEAHIAGQLQAMQMQGQTDQTADATPATGAVAMASAEAKCECGPHTKAVLDQRQATAAAGVTPQV